MVIGLKQEDIQLVTGIMRDFARITGLEPLSKHPKRYLWTDSFAVCNYIELFLLSENESFLELAVKLVDQVHHTLGRHRNDDSRAGWISGLNDEEGELHPTSGGLRIGKELNERKPDEPYDERLEWDQDGQYYHYITKWMHALHRMSQTTNDSKYDAWAVELAKTAHKSFIYTSPFGKRMYWKMSIDLSYPLVPAMGQQDALDGFITYNEINKSGLASLNKEIMDITSICNMSWAKTTTDPLSIGSFLFDALRVTQLIVRDNNPNYLNLLDLIINTANYDLESFSKDDMLNYPAEYRLAFRELGLSIGLKGIEKLVSIISSKPDLFINRELLAHVDTLKKYSALSNSIDLFWIDETNRKSPTWIDHLEINMVMLATSLAPDAYLNI